MAYVISDDCIACGTCIDECPVGAISEGDKYSIDPDACTECGTCADACPSEAIIHDMETILNLSFCWEGKLIELLCFHSLKYSLSLVLLDGLIQLFCSFSQEYKGFLLGSQTWDHPHHCRLQVRQEETGMLCILDPSAQKSFHWYNL